MHQWYQESLDSILLAKKYSPDNYHNDLQTQFLNALNYTMIEEYDEAKIVYESILKYPGVNLIREITLWNNYNNFSLGHIQTEIEVLNNLSNVINLYSDDMYWQLIFAEIESNLNTNNFRPIEKLFKEIREATSEKDINSLKYFKAEYYIKRQQLNLAKQLLEELDSNKTDTFNYVRSKFVLLKIEREQNKISLDTAIKTLKKLQLVWRGDQLEYDILIQLATYYISKNDMLNTMRTYQYIQSVFNNKITNFYIISQMSKIFNDVFRPGGIGENLDDFTLVALFYEFKDMNPIGAQGDQIILSIAQRLVKLDLIDKAIELLKHQVKHRLKAIQKIDYANKLAILYMIDNKPQEAINILNDTDRDNFSFQEHQYRLRLKARALMDLQKYDSTIQYLEDDYTEEAMIIRKEALFKMQKWQDYIYNTDLNDLIRRQEDNRVKQDILRLAIAYYKTNNQENLISLEQKVSNANIHLKNTINLLITSNKKIDHTNLDKSLQINQMESLLEDYRQQFLRRN